ncbi:hypothetical protein N7449_000034 [Penicillium cf. viridicatum]|uniref:Reverse transcriptase domain-containing protein n=1 Tax=Penicillium cf. viridicatum TaxID=2972119 RepID=A0A9W9N498_9EURO|nr:hypothetical protein N7449_000034 [Penicillium cf. viridicatum]
MADFLAKPEVSKADIIAENPYNDTTYHPLKQTHELLYPSSAETGGEQECRVGTSWTHYVYSEFCQEVRFQTGLGEICFFNIYNECGTTGTVELFGVLLEGRRHVILAGDFNLYHPVWGGIEAIQDLGSDRLIELCDEVDLDLWLEPGIVIRDQNGERTTIDLLFGTLALTERLVVCQLALDCHADSDHLPICALIDVEMAPVVEAKRRLWKAMDTEKFDIFVADNLPMPPLLTTPRQIDDVVNHLIDIVQRGVHESTLWAKPSSHANPSWTKECGEAVKHSRRIFPEGGAAETDVEKVNLLRKLQLLPVNDTEVRAAINKALPNKAPGYDILPNKVWRVLAEIGSRSEERFIPLLTAIFDACHFQTSVTITLRKAGPRDYRVPKSYRPVALLNTLGKILEVVVVTRIAWCVEEYKLLPDTYLGGRKGVSVYQVWGEGKTASMLLLDMAGVYDMSFLTGRSTRIKLPNGYLSSPISPILFLLFNALLVRACILRGLYYGESEAYGWVDDMCILAVSNSYEENTKLLEKALQRASIWAKKYIAKFVPDKFELIHFTNPKPNTLAYCDKHLNFTVYRKKMLAKGAGSLEALRAQPKSQTPIPGKLRWQEELQGYLNLRTDEDDPYRFWRLYKKEFLTLTALARDIFSIPATSVGVERLFSSARDIYHYRRGSLNIRTI